METIFKPAESRVKPLEIDITSAPGEVYVRRDIKELTREDSNGETITYFRYNEALLTADEYEVYSKDLIAKSVNGENNSTAFENFVKKLHTPIIYPVNGLLYEPAYYEVYESEINKKGIVLYVAEKAGKDITPILSQTFAVYDSTELVENMRRMTLGDIVDLYFYLLGIKEQYFAEYKLEKVS